MVLTPIHCNMSIIDSSNEDINIRPQIDGNDVTIEPNLYGSGSTAQSLVNNLGQIAFNRQFKGIDDSADINDLKSTYSIDKIKSIIDDTNEILVDTKFEYSGWFGINSGGLPEAR